MLRDIPFNEVSQHGDGSITTLKCGENGKLEFVNCAKDECEDPFPWTLIHLETGFYAKGFGFGLDTIASMFSNVRLEDTFTYGLFLKSGVLLPRLEEPFFMEQREDSLPEYGVADNLEQIKEKYKAFLTSEQKFVFEVTPVYKSHQEAEGGWRWHKWGEYIGTQIPTCEYLYDEPIIEEVMCFHIYKFKEN